MLKRTVEINSKEFKEAVLSIFKESTKFINDIENPRYERLFDGWIKDYELGLDLGPSSSESMNYTKAQEYCKNLGGRLPTVDELNAIIDRTLYNPACDQKVFKDVKSQYYWCSDKYMGCPNAYWCVSFDNGFVSTSIECFNNYVRPVRASQ